MTRKRHALMAAALGGLAAGACATIAADAGEPERQILHHATVEVANNNWLDVNVYAVRSGQRARLGTVSSMNTGTFRIPEAMVGSGEVQLMAAPIGSPRVHRTDPILIVRGDRIRWNVENRLAQSSYTVRHGAPR